MWPSIYLQMSSETLKCCKICGAFLTCNHKGECCPECSYFDEKDYLCLAPEQLKKAAKSKKVKSEVEETFEDDEVDPETFLFEDDEDEDLDEIDEEDEDDFDDDEDYSYDDDWD